MEGDNRKPFKIKDVTRAIKKAVVAESLTEMKLKVAEKFSKGDMLPTIHFDCDGTEVDDEEYFRTLEANAELIAVFPGERWVDATHYLTISSRSSTADQTDAENVQLKKLVGQLQNNLCDVSVVSGPDLDSLSNMDPNSLADITGKDFMDSIKDASGSGLREQRTSSDSIELLESVSSNETSSDGVVQHVYNRLSDEQESSSGQPSTGTGSNDDEDEDIGNAADDELTTTEEKD